MVVMSSGDEPSTGAQVGVSAALLVIDVVVIAWLVFIQYGMAGWADSYNGGAPPSAPKEALRGMWLLVGGAVVTGGGLLALGWRLPGVVQLIVLGVGAVLLGYFAAHG
ncbi:hypothetical protein PEM37_12555 [Streptomyces sp. AD681]|uniref:hypothetical protein n=1 Tax=Streptomyces sp. AD681 TaxID=3019069 RepID=UPI0022F17146|nr:hypothetical protein [Streptomyces sp. AD681]MDA5142341.1 hypothetical protein [Streptomyces sp. AD681]